MASHDPRGRDPLLYPYCTDSTSLLTCELREIRTPFVTRVLRFVVPRQWAFRIAQCRDHDWGVGALTACRVPEKSSESCDCARGSHIVVAPTPPIAPPRDACSGSTEVSGTRMRIRVTNRPSLTLLEPKIRSARLRRGCSMLRMKKAQEKMESRAGPH